jgi:hypothetical protein
MLVKNQCRQDLAAKKACKKGMRKSRVLFKPLFTIGVRICPTENELGCWTEDAVYQGPVLASHAASTTSALSATSLHCVQPHIAILSEQIN